MNVYVREDVAGDNYGMSSRHRARLAAALAVSIKLSPYVVDESLSMANS